MATIKRILIITDGENTEIPSNNDNIKSHVLTKMGFTDELHSMFNPLPGGCTIISFIIGADESKHKHICNQLNKIKI